MASLVAKPEVLNWIPIEHETPDEGVVVLLFHLDASEPVWPKPRLVSISRSGWTFVKRFDRAMLKAEKVTMWPEDTEKWAGFSEIEDRVVKF